jgi:hypothetical protein
VLQLGVGGGGGGETKMLNGVIVAVPTKPVVVKVPETV